MSVMCIICTDFLTERPQGRNNEEFIMSALTCGHLFHHSCIKRWFTGSGGVAQIPGGGSCPSCKKVSQLSKAIRIYPAGDEDSDAVVKDSRDLKVVTADNQKLETRLRDVTTELSDLRRQHEEESAAHEALKLRFAQVLSQVEAQSDQLRENDEMSMALEDSVKMVLEKVEKEKAEALDMLARMQLKSAIVDN